MKEHFISQNISGKYSAITPLCSTPSPDGLFFLAFILYYGASFFYSTTMIWLRFLCLHDPVSVGRGQNVQQLFALAVVSVHAFHRRCLCTRTQRNLFCLIFSNKFNIMSAVFANNRPPCRKKSILAKVRFDLKWR